MGLRKNRVKRLANRSYAIPGGGDDRDFQAQDVSRWSVNCPLDVNIGKAAGRFAQVEATSHPQQPVPVQQTRLQSGGHARSPERGRHP